MEAIKGDAAVDLQPRIFVARGNDGRRHDDSGRLRRGWIAIEG
jgi:hypothetical protein